MKAVYQAISARITAQVPAIRWVDFDLGQLDATPPPVSWPCALIDFAGDTVEQFGDNAGAETLAIEVVLGFRLRERTHSKTTETFRDEALEHLDTVEAVRTALEGLSATTFTPLAYNGFDRDRRSDYRVYRLRFACSRYPAPPPDTYLPWTDAGGEGEGPGFCIHPDLVV